MALEHTGGITVEQLKARVAAIGGTSFRGELSAAMAATAHRELLRGFQQSVDPYGRPWAPVDRFQRLRGRRQGPMQRGKPLIKTNELRASSVAEATPEGFRVGFASDHSAIHQKGSKKKRGRGGGIRRRQMIPERETGGLGTWKAPLDATAGKVFKRWGRGR
ncbi:MAG: phage virion morphogenesis protein [Pseudomonadota bacterium]